ncbi:MAG: DNA-binding response regulator LuxR family near polyamine transporter [Comamonadaceae bacterium]|nr:MAG: DNA-binding response regulator LuxR family near polyamine transporter [Comamonadaceae bacterium]
MIRLMIVDDHAIVRMGLKQIFTQTPDIEVVAEMPNGSLALDYLRENTVDLVLLDLTMPGVSGHTLVSRLHARFPRIRILVLTMHEEPQIVQLVLKAGASGYLSKDSEPEFLLQAIYKVIAGGRFIDPKLAEQMVFDMSGHESSSSYNHLTEREIEIMRMFADGMSGSDIASQLSISQKTVSTHKVNIMEKMGFTSIAELVRYAIDHGLVT